LACGGSNEGDSCLRGISYYRYYSPLSAFLLATRATNNGDRFWATKALRSRPRKLTRTYLALLTSFDEAGSVRLNRARSEPVEVVSQPKQ
jgi:hypothetical protein